MSEAVDRLLQGYERGTLSRRELVAGLSGLVAGAAAAQPEERLAVRSLNHATMFVPDVDAAVEFYQRLFDMPVLSRQSGGTNLRAGDDGQFLGIFRGRDDAALIHHFCLGVDSFDSDGLVARLAERGVQARVRMRDGVVPEIYFADPNGIQVQLQDASYCGGGGPLGNDCG